MKKLQLKCENLTIAYDRVNVFENMSFEVNEGDYLSIVGENGSGKSSLIKGILGLVPIRKGEVIFEGGVTKKNIGYLPQHTAAQSDFPASVYEVILSGCLANAGFRPFYTSNDKKRVKKIMEKLGITDLAQKTFGNLSGGQKQRAAVARALITNPQIILADEPTGALDSKSTDQLLELFSKINGRGQTILMVTHSTKAASKAGRVLFIKDGEVFHQIYKASMTDEEMYTKISDTLTVLATGGESLE